MYEIVDIVNMSHVVYHKQVVLAVMYQRRKLMLSYEHPS